MPEDFSDEGPPENMVLASSEFFVSENQALMM